MMMILSILSCFFVITIMIILSVRRSLPIFISSFFSIHRIVLSQNLTCSWIGSRLLRVLKTIEMTIRHFTSIETSQLLKIIRCESISELSIRIKLIVIQKDDSSTITLNMSLFSTAMTLHSYSCTFLCHMTNLITSKTRSRITIVMMMIFQTVHTFIFLLLEYTVFSDMATFPTSKTLDQSFLLLDFIYDIEVTQRTFPGFLLLLLHLLIR